MWRFEKVIIFLLSGMSLCRAQVTASFTIPDTVCINTPMAITNNSSGASTYSWNFCTASLSSTPKGTLLGNPGNMMAVPVFADYGYDNGKYYALVVNNSPGGLIRLDFGNSMLNTPVPTDLGNFGGIIPNSAQGIQLVQSNSRWYAIITGGDPTINGAVEKNIVFHLRQMG